MDSSSLSDEQACIVRAVVDMRQSIFITGGAGTGKSHTLRVVIAKLREKFSGLPSGAVAVVAPTGQAALQVDGATIHSWARLNPHAKTIDQVPKIHRDPWRLARVLVIDEVSMVSLELFQLLNDLAQRARDSQEPFGGLQVICCGDFLQLPPVNGEFCFKSHAWKSVIKQTFQLTETYRQAQDPDFVDVLRRIRLGEKDAIAPLKRCTLRAPTGDDIKPTRLYAKRADVETENLQELDKLPGPIYSCRAQEELIHFNNDKSTAWKPLAPSNLQLKIGAQVVLLRNLDASRGLVNGSRGVVVGFSNGHAPSVRFACGETRTLERAVWELRDNANRVLARSQQYPLDLAWALTIHKSQGMSLDCVHVDLSGCFAPGMAYVALSRCQSREGLTISGLSPKAISAHPDALAFYSREAQSSNEAEDSSDSDSADAFIRGKQHHGLAPLFKRQKLA